MESIEGGSELIATQAEYISIHCLVKLDSNIKVVEPSIFYEGDVWEA